MKLVLDVGNKMVHVEGNQCPVPSFQRFVSWEEVWALDYKMCHQCKERLLQDARV